MGLSPLLGASGGRGGLDSLHLPKNIRGGQHVEKDEVLENLRTVRRAS